MATSPTKSYVIWTVAGAIALIALIIGLSNRNATTTEPQPPVIIDARPIPTPESAPRLDVVFTIDATGSMGDEIDVVKREVWNIANGLMAGNPRPDVRFGLVFYQDRGDAFLVKKTELTRNIDAIHSELTAIQAGGGGDWREHVGRGLHESLALDWDMSPNTARMIYLVGDAPGHDDYQDGYSIDAAIEIARTRNIKVHTVGCSGLDSGQAEFEKIAQQTGGAYKPLTYQAVVTDDTGVQRSVIYYGGEAYEADKVLPKSDWARGGDVLLNEGKLKKARPSVARQAAAPGASTDNNLDGLIESGVKGEAEARGVTY